MWLPLDDNYVGSVSVFQGTLLYISPFAFYFKKFTLKLILTLEKNKRKHNARITSFYLMISRNNFNSYLPELTFKSGNILPIFSHYTTEDGLKSGM
jgi:hypothetical protein